MLMEGGSLLAAIALGRPNLWGKKGKTPSRKFAAPTQEAPSAFKNCILLPPLHPWYLVMTPTSSAWQARAGGFHRLPMYPHSIVMQGSTYRPSEAGKLATGSFVVFNPESRHRLRDVPRRTMRGVVAAQTGNLSPRHLRGLGCDDFSIGKSPLRTMKC